MQKLQLCDPQYVGVPHVGKLRDEREEPPRADNNGGSDHIPPKRDTVEPLTASSSQPRTTTPNYGPPQRGSLGLDLATATDVTVIDQKPVQVPSMATGPMIINRSPVGCLLFGRSSTGLNGVTVLPGLIDADFTGIIQIVIQRFFPPVHIPTRSQIVQLVPLPALTQSLQLESDMTRENKGFGSTGGLVMLTVPMKQ